MDVRSYWISKLPTVRRQSPATGRLVESLLINDSSVARSALVEMARMRKTGVKLKEDESVQAHVNGLKQSITTMQGWLGQMDKADDVDPKEYQKIEKSILVAEDRLKSFVSQKEATDSEKISAKKISEKAKELFEKTGLSKVWNKIKPIIKFTTQLAIVVSFVIIAVVFSVYIKNKYKSVGAGIGTFVASVLALAIFANGIFSLKKFFKEIWDMLVHLYETIKGWFNKGSAEKKEAV